MSQDAKNFYHYTTAIASIAPPILPTQALMFGFGRLAIGVWAAIKQGTKGLLNKKKACGSEDSSPYEAAGGGEEVMPPVPHTLENINLLGDDGASHNIALNS